MGEAVLSKIERDVVSKRHSKAPFDVRYLELVSQDMNMNLQVPKDGNERAPTELTTVGRELKVRCSLILAQVQTLQAQVKVLASAKVGSSGNHERATQVEGGASVHLIEQSKGGLKTVTHQQNLLCSHVERLRQCDSTMSIAVLLRLGCLQTRLVDFSEAGANSDDFFPNRIEMPMELQSVTNRTSVAQRKPSPRMERPASFLRYLRLVRPFSLAFCASESEMSEEACREIPSDAMDPDDEPAFATDEMSGIAAPPVDNQDHIDAFDEPAEPEDNAGHTSGDKEQERRNSSEAFEDEKSLDPRLKRPREDQFQPFGNEEEQTGIPR